MRILVEELRYARVDEPFIGGFSPYAHQVATLREVRQAIQQNKTVCVENASVTGSGKTLANFAAAILDGTRTIGVYPTNELLMDQYVSLKRHVSPHDLLLSDSKGLDDIMAHQTHMRSHAHALSWATGDDIRPMVLTNPDVLHLAMYNLYGQMFSNFGREYGARTFQHILSNYPVIAFDEFHLYNPKQIANAAFMVGTAKELAPDKPHVFIFSSATPPNQAVVRPQDQLKRYLARLRLEAVSVTDSPADTGDIVCEPMEINLLPGDLLRWQGGEAIRAELDEILSWADNCIPLARGVFIVDSVYEAKKIAKEIRTRRSSEEVGEVHGYIESSERASALLRRFSVGTTTIDVGVDLTDLKSKEFLVCEARSPAQAVQRIGRLGRNRRKPGDIPVPNRVWLVVPDYVYHYIQERGYDHKTVSRRQFNDLLHEAYLGQEDFSQYAVKYAPLEAVAACERILPQDFEDTKDTTQAILHRLVPTLYDKEIPQSMEEAEKSYNTYLRIQRAKWSTFGTLIKTSSSTSKSKFKRYYLSDLESFRGGITSDFSVAIYDELDSALGFKPVKVYDPTFALRFTECRELTRQQFAELIQRKHPKEAKRWLDELEQQRNLLGYMHVERLIEGKANEVYFEIRNSLIDNRFHQIISLEGFAIGGSGSRLLRAEQSINGELKKRRLNCWISEKKSYQLSRSFPPLFAIYPLHALNPGGKYDEWSMAVGLNAFFLDSISHKLRWAIGRSDNTAIIL